MVTYTLCSLYWNVSWKERTKMKNWHSCCAKTVLWLSSFITADEMDRLKAECRRVQIARTTNGLILNCWKSVKAVRCKTWRSQADMYWCRQSESWMVLKNILYWKMNLCPHVTCKFHSLNIIYTRIRFQTKHTTHCIPPVWSLEQQKLWVRSVEEHQSDQSNITFPSLTEPLLCSGWSM